MVTRRCYDVFNCFTTELKRECLGNTCLQKIFDRDFTVEEEGTFYWTHRIACSGLDVYVLSIKKLQNG